MGTNGHHQERDDESRDAADRHLEHPIDCGFDRSHMSDSGNQEHQYARECRGAEAWIDRCEQGQRRDGDREHARQRHLTAVGHQCGEGAGINGAA